MVILKKKNVCDHSAIVPCMHAPSQSARMLWSPKSPMRKHLRHQPNPLWGPQPQLQKITRHRVSVRDQAEFYAMNICLKNIAPYIILNPLISISTLFWGMPRIRSMIMRPRTPLGVYHTSAKAQLDANPGGGGLDNLWAQGPIHTSVNISISISIYIYRPPVVKPYL